MNNTVARSWMRALQLTAPIARNRDRILSSVIEEVSLCNEKSPALLFRDECVSYGQLAFRVNQYSRWALDYLEKGDVVCLLMTNHPDYLATWLGITATGGVVALLNSNLVGESLSHCIDVVKPKHLIVSEQLLQGLNVALSGHESMFTTWIYGTGSTLYQSINQELSKYPGGSRSKDERPFVSVDDRALCIYTSGTTGLPKAASVSHGRIMQWTHWFSGMMEARRSDRMYACLPMYHSVGGVQAPGAMLISGASVYIGEKFSVSHFWSDVVRRDCTIFQYIGELCRYLVNAKPSPDELSHRLRLICGNGLAPDVWSQFQNRFQIPRILEFYASTEGGVSLFNVEARPGSIGRVPSYLKHRFSPALIRIDSESGEPTRDEHGYCIPCGFNEVGEALGRFVDTLAAVGTKFEGYIDADATKKKFLSRVFEKDDTWIRTGDLMKKDDHGFFYFVDRIGDTFRWKGENVATSEVSGTICGFPGVAHAAVYGVRTPIADGRVGMAAVVATEELDLAGLHRYLQDRLPTYARPRFLRIQSELAVTGTFKYSKTELVTQGFNPATTTDRLYFDSRDSQSFVPLRPDLYELITRGEINL